MPFFHTRRKRRRSQRSQDPRTVLIKQTFIGVLLFALLGLVVAGVWYGSRVERLTIEAIEVTGGETIDHARVRDIVRGELAGAYYHLVPRRFAWTYPASDIAARVSELERTKDVYVERVSGTKISVSFTERKPFALWCATPTSTSCLFLDAAGYAFGQAPELRGGSFIRFTEPDTNPTVGDSPFHGSFVRANNVFITRVYDELGLNIIHVEKIGTDEAVYHIAGGGDLKASLRMDPDETFENLATILRSDEFDHIEPGNFQYIDLRYGNKIFVNEEEPVTATSASRVSTSTATSTE